MLAAQDYWLDSTKEERETGLFKKEYANLVRQSKKYADQLKAFAKKMTDKEWDIASEGTDTSRADFIDDL